MPALSLLSSPSFAPLHYPRYRSLAERSSMASCVWTHLQQPGCRRWVTINTYRDSRVRVSRDVINVQPRLRGVVLDIVSRYLHTRVRQREHADRHDTHCHARARLCWTCHAFFPSCVPLLAWNVFFSPPSYISRYSSCDPEGTANPLKSLRRIFEARFLFFGIYPVLSEKEFYTKAIVKRIDGSILRLGVYLYVELTGCFRLIKWIEKT